MASTELQATAANETLAHLRTDAGDVDTKWNVPNGLQGTGDVDHSSVQETPEPAPSAAVDAAPHLRPAIAPDSLAENGSKAAQASIPHPKRFSAVNINKKFLEKTATAPATSSPNAHQSASKLNTGPSPKPVAPTPVPSRLVTTKLTASQLPSAGAGWSRPPSTSSSAGPTPAPGSTSTPGPVPLPHGQTAAPQLPHAGKIIQPQSRTTAGASGRRDSSSGPGKQAWVSMKAPLGDQTRPFVPTRSDFPTAAEVAQVRAQQVLDSIQAAQLENEQKQVMQEQADAFRGVHLNPNAHHWDEMEEDDDIFSNEVIDFGDGRTYKVESAPSPPGGLRTLPKDYPELRTLPKDYPELRTLPKDYPELGQIKAYPKADVPVTKEERFADDFDRSWPRNRQGGSMPPASHPREPPPHVATSPVSPYGGSVEPSRVLFNERSNKLEPYSHPTTRTGPPTAPQPYPGRSSRTEGLVSPTDRLPRDYPPHVQQQNVQLLQKNGWSPDTRPTHQTGVGPPPSEPSLAAVGGDVMHQELAPVGSPVSTHVYSPPNDRQGRPANGARLNAGPPGHNGKHTYGAVPTGFPTGHDAGQDRGRQLPPHLSMPPPPPPKIPSPSSPRRPQAQRMAEPSREREREQPPARPPVAPPAQQTPAEPASSLSAAEYETASKAAMQSMAERARIRRQQEEEERERDRERARKKAAELEEKIKASSAASSPAQEIVSAAKISSVNQQQPSHAGESHTGIASVPARPSDVPARLVRPPSVQGEGRALGRPSIPRRLSSAIASEDLNSPATTVESWRSKAVPLPALEHSPVVTDSFSAQVVPPVIPPSAPAMQALHSLESATEEGLETFDFAELGKLVGADASPDSLPQRAPTTRRRPVAADFMDEPSATQDAERPPRPQEQSWRRAVPPAMAQNNVDAKSAEKSLLAQTTLEGQNSDRTYVANSEIDTTQQGHTRPQPLGPQAGFAPSTISSQKSPRSATFKEAPMSALDDVISRIKGALDVMQKDATPTATALQEADCISEAAATTGTEASQTMLAPTFTSADKPKWLPPALRANPPTFRTRPRVELPKPEEPFDITSVEPPKSPKSAWNTFNVRLPKVSVRRLHIPTKQYNIAGPVRWDILSFDPPVQGMNKQAFSLNDVLFPKPPAIKNIPQCRVMLPQGTSTQKQPAKIAVDVGSGPRVHLPSPSVSASPGSTVSAGAFGKPKAADGPSTWRKAAPTATHQEVNTTSQATLDTTSRSPPPEMPVKQAPHDNAIPSESRQPVEAVSAMSQHQPPSDTAIATPAAPSLATSNGLAATSQEPAAQSPAKGPFAQQLVFKEFTPANGLPMASVAGSSSLPEGLALPKKAESKSSDESTEPPITPALAQSAVWSRSPFSLPVKELVSSSPETDRLKAVWSQASHKAGLPAVNSLERIGDDLTGLPFTIQEVKSEMATPPPSSSAAPSRMSLSDVTRAFQQVPALAASAPPSQEKPAPAAPTPSTSVPPFQPAYSYMPGPAPVMRPGFPPYGSPMLSSPSPTMVYTHAPPMAASPAPRPMSINGHAPLHMHQHMPPHMTPHGPSHAPPYGQPMWMMPPPAPTPGTIGQSLAPPYGSPYGQSHMPYGPPSVGSPYGAPSPVMHHAQPVTPGMGRGRGMPMLSPIGGPAPPGSMPLYAGSPVSVHAQAVPMGPGHHPFPGYPPNARSQAIGGPFSPAPGGTAILNPPPPAPPHAHYPLPPPQGPTFRPSW